MTNISRMLHEYKTTGHIWLRSVVPPQDIAQLKALLSEDHNHQALSRRSNNQTELFSFISQAQFTKTIQAAWPNMRPVRLVTFEKNTETNWSLPWHQDRVIAVQDKIETDGFSNWTKKSGVWHCEPPVTTLEKMLFVRVHLDKNTKTNGAMEIALNSHSKGKILASQATETAQKHTTEVTTAEAGDVLVLPMLTLHRSLPSETKECRQTLRIDFACDPLPNPLKWI